VLACPPDGLRASFFNVDESEAIAFERYRDADAAIEHFANISDLMEHSSARHAISVRASSGDWLCAEIMAARFIMATATVTGEVRGTPNAEMRRNLTGDQPKLFTPWMTMEQEVAG
jgi:hypothetical protein